MRTSAVDILTADILVVGGGTGGTAAAIQAARQNAHLRVVLVSELPWLGGMLTSAGVSAPDGNELAAFQTGLWGAFLKELNRRHPGGLSNGWVSFFTYSPAVGAQIFADWVAALPNLHWISQQRPKRVLRSPLLSQDCITGVQFDTLTVKAKITLDATELGDLLALGDVPHRWGWETQSIWQEPSAPVSLTDPSDPLYSITQRYPVQSPTWVVVMQDYGTQHAPPIESPPICSPDGDFEGAWTNYGDRETPGGEACLNYGRLPNGQLMINWPHHGNDYGIGLHRLIESDRARAQYGQEAQWHSQSFARYIQRQLGNRYGLAQGLFPPTAQSPGSAFALMPYYRESRRGIGLQTVSEQDILPVAGAQVAALPINAQGEMSAIAYGNYPNDHHYPGYEMPLAPKSIQWGGRTTGTPFTIPYEALVPKDVDGLMMCEKNISVSHIANGATRLQPVVLGIGQA
ncbi:MAG: FAD-dependent oxidoreductase, partial [Cyanobacteria bacterium P01_D01_bin.105]